MVVCASEVREKRAGEGEGRGGREKEGKEGESEQDRGGRGLHNATAVKVPCDFATGIWGAALLAQYPGALWMQLSCHALPST